MKKLCMMAAVTGFAFAMNTQDSGIETQAFGVVALHAQRFELSENQPLLDYRLQRQWMGQRSFSNARVAFHDRNWHLNLNTWNRYIRGVPVEFNLESATDYKALHAAQWWLYLQYEVQ